MGDQEMATPLVSVIVPIYKVEPYLRACVDSILNQTYPNVEVILVDDGSPDDCPAICDEYAANNVSVSVLHQCNGGLSAARNNGLALSQGEYVTFVDSDDWLSPTMVERCMQLINMHDADACGVIFMRSYADHNVPNPCYSLEPECYTSKEALGRYLFNTNMTVCVCGKVWKRSLWDTIRCPTGILHEDQYTTYRLLDRATKVVFDPEPLYFYRQRVGSIGHSTFSARSYDLLKGIDAQYSFISRKYPDIEKSIGTACSFWYAVFVNMMIRSDYRDARAAIRCKEFVRQHIQSILQTPYLSPIRKVQLLLFSLSLKLYAAVYLLCTTKLGLAE